MVPRLKKAVLFQQLLKWFSNLSVHQIYLQGLWKHRLLGPAPRVSISVGPGKGPRICISEKFPGDADVAGLGTTSGEPPSYRELYLGLS